MIYECARYIKENHNPENILRAERKSAESCGGKPSRPSKSYKRYKSHRTLLNVSASILCVASFILLYSVTKNIKLKSVKLKIYARSMILDF